MVTPFTLGDSKKERKGWLFMSQSGQKVPEYIVEEQAEMQVMVNPLNYSSRDFSQVLVDLEELRKASLLSEELSGNIAGRLQALVLSLQDMV